MVFRQIVCYLAEQFRQIVCYLAELSCQIASIENSFIFFKPSLIGYLTLSCAHHWLSYHSMCTIIKFLPLHVSHNKNLTIACSPQEKSYHCMFTTVKSYHCMFTTIFNLIQHVHHNNYHTLASALQ